MSSVQVRTNLAFPELLQAVEQLSPPDLEQLRSRIANLQARNKAPNLSAKESELLQKINVGLSPEKQQLFDALVARRQAEKITANELQELMALTEQIEKADAERVYYLVELAQLREKPLLDLMNEPGCKQIKPTLNVATEL
jgi:hypothetical protein